MATSPFKVWQGERGTGAFVDYNTDITEGMVVLDAMLQIQAEHAQRRSNAMTLAWRNTSSA